MDVTERPEACPKWYALRVRSRHEKLVHAHLEAKNRNAFLPLYHASHKWADRRKTVHLPMFPGYVFCRFDATLRYSVLATPGVVDIVRVGTEPAAIEDSEIEAVQLIVRSQAPAEPYPDIIAGQRMMISGGPLNGLAGTLAEIRNGLRLVVCVELLCRSVMVEVSRQWVVPLDQPRSAPSGRAFSAGVCR